VGFRGALAAPPPIHSADDRRNLGAGNPREHAMTKSRDQKKDVKKKPAKTKEEKKAAKKAKKSTPSFI
jgi:hypothetical protein